MEDYLSKKVIERFMKSLGGGRIFVRQTPIGSVVMTLKEFVVTVTHSVKDGYDTMRRFPIAKQFNGGSIVINRVQLNRAVKAFVTEKKQ